MMVTKGLTMVVAHGKVAPISGEYWTKEKNGRTWNWCKCHEYWTATHNSKMVKCNTITQQIIATSPNLQTKIIED